MVRYLFRRTVSGLITLFLFLSFMFFFTNLIMPGDYVSQFALGATPEQLAEMREELGLDLPLWQQYLFWMRGLFTGSLGTSMTGESVWSIMQQLLPATLFIFFTGTVIAFFIGQWLGKLTAWRGPGAISDTTTMGAIMLYTTFPPWLAFLMVYIFARQLGWFAEIIISPFDKLTDTIWEQTALQPSTVMWYVVGSIIAFLCIIGIANNQLRRFTRRIPPFLTIIGYIAALVGSWFLLGFGLQTFDLLRVSGLLIITYVLLSLGEVMLIMQTGMRDVQHEEYIHTARAKGLPPHVVRDRHAARNAILPVFSRLVVSIPYLLAGLVIIEQSFNWPGMGAGLFGRLITQDFPTVLGVLMFVGILSLGARLILDIIHVSLDPRLQYQHIAK